MSRSLLWEEPPWHRAQVSKSSAPLWQARPGPALERQSRDSLKPLSRSPCLMPVLPPPRPRTPGRPGLRGGATWAQLPTHFHQNRVAFAALDVYSHLLVKHLPLMKPTGEPWVLPAPAMHFPSMPVLLAPFPPPALSGQHQGDMVPSLKYIYFY